MSPSTRTEPDTGRRIIVADTVVAGGRILRPGWLILTGGRVAGSGQGRPPHPLSAARGDVDLGAATVVPGFVDLHVHGGGGGSFGTDPEAGARAVDFHRRHGTTTMLGSLVTASPGDLLDAVSAQAELVEDGLLAGTHLEGPWLSRHRCGAHRVDQLRDPDAAELTRVLAVGRGTIRMVTVAPERSGGLDAVAALSDAGVLAAVGHTDGGYEVTRRAIGAGARVATHLFNAMRPVHHREPGPIVALTEDDRVALELVLDGQHVHPAIYRQVEGSVGLDRTVLVTDAMAAAGMADGSYRLGDLAVDVRDRVARLAGRDTIAGSTATMDVQFANAIRFGAGAPDERLLAAVRQTSANPARLLGPTAERLGIGDLGIGHRADLVALDPHGQVSAVLVAGEHLPGVADRDDFAIRCGR
ncbi:MAG TPA: amidohydrolase family protein [Microlunatus sp.]|nr:amidohydrolase family protein [Microlunatus sp.]